MKTKTLIACFLLLVSLLSLSSCVEEYPEPVFDPESVKEEEKVSVGMEDVGGIHYVLYNDMTCHVAEFDKENLSSLALVIPSYYADYKVVAIEDDVFRGADLASVTLPETLVSIGDSAFQKCTMEKINLPDSLKEIGEECFDNCLNLTEIKIGKNVKEIPLGAFSGCRKLKSVTLSQGVEIIGEEAFSSLSSLETLTLPESLREIGPYAFFSSGTETLSITIPASTKKIGKDAFRGTAFLKAQKDEFVLVGDGVLLSYHGEEKEVFLPENVKYLSNAFDKSSAEKITLNASLTGICPEALSDSSVKSLSYNGKSKEVLSFMKDFNN